MSRGLRVLIAGFVAGACSLALAGPAQAITFTVDDLSDVADDTPDSVCDATGSDTCTLRAALDELNLIGAGIDTIDISVAGTINLTLPNELSVVAPTVLNGNAGGTTIDAGGTSRVLAAGGSSVTLNDLRLEGGALLNSSGAGILSTATLLTLNRVTVAGNTVDSNMGGSTGAGINTSGTAQTLVLNDSTVSGNTIIGTGGLGGGIRTGGPLTLNRSTVSGNSTTLDIGGRGGGIDANAQGAFALNISNSTISDNHSGGIAGGGVFATSLATITIVGSTIAGNTTLGQGGGVRAEGSTISENTIYAGNTAAVGGPNCAFGSTPTPENNIDTGTSCGFGTANGNQENVATGALGLGALASNGGPTQTRAIASGSVAQNAASGDCGGLTVDQRGTARPQGASCDIGAFELVPPPAVVTGPPAVLTPAPKKCKKGQKLKKGKCVKKKKK
jgi:hypothetical protein